MGILVRFDGDFQAEESLFVRLNGELVFVPAGNLVPEGAVCEDFESAQLVKVSRSRSPFDENGEVRL